MAKKTFEDSLAQLESIVEALESGDLPLEKAIKTFEEGVRLSRFCFEKLDETEKKINLLLKDQDGTIRENTFFESGNEQEND
ncbi:MAG: exodeoxyribonuclease VII small subunit [Desulfobacteraceae bacterium]|jgi:exodeoxyribonuclease VII small subunit|nr:MAG: exodeoxyribonuclease VII small subunit [Desulfobacteraceae bacterium]